MVEKAAFPSGRQNLPDQYAHFDRIKEYAQMYTADLKSTREENYFGQAYQDAWTTLCMVIDAGQQKAHVASLREQLKGVKRSDNPQYHDQKREEYWENLKTTSVFPIYNRLASEFRARRYGQQTVEQYWTHDFAVLKWDVDQKRNKALLEPAKSIYPNIYGYNLFSKTYGIEKGAGRTTKRMHTDLDQVQFEENDANPNNLKGYMTALQLLASSRDMIFEPLSSLIEQFEAVNEGTLKVTVTNWETKIRDLLKKTEPYYYLGGVLAKSIQEKENELFGDEVKLASSLWRTTVYMRTSEKKKGDIITAMRKPILRSLVQGNYQQARYQIEELMADRPEMFQSFVKENLQVEPDVLAALYKEEAKEEKQKRRLKEVEAVQETKRQEKIAESLKPLIGQELSNSDGTVKIKIISLHKNHFFFMEVGGTIAIRDFLGSSRSRNLTAENLKTLLQIFDLKTEED